MSALPVLRQVLPRVVTITVGEHLDYRSIQCFRELCHERYQDDVEIHVDLSATRYVDSSGVALLLCLYQWMIAPHLQVRLQHCCAELREIFERARCADLLPIDS